MLKISGKGLVEANLLLLVVENVNKTIGEFKVDEEVVENLGDRESSSQ